MANYKVVYADQLDADIKIVADAIRAKNGTTEELSFPGGFKTAIESITTGGGAASDDVRYVTFMNGDTVLYKKAVATGDDCVDVLAKGLIETPTKESDDQYDYTYYGWGASDGGAADDTILQNITEDKTVYAIYTKTVRYYTITYYDDDGVTVLNTETLAYGAMPSYTPTKDGYIIYGWTPEFAAVTGDASYVVIWQEGYSFAKTDWAKISEISEAGEASKYFAVGDTREQDMGDLGTVTVMILGFDHDDLSTGGKAGLSIGMVQPSGESGTPSTMGSSALYSSLPSDLQAVLKIPAKTAYASGFTTFKPTNKLCSFTIDDFGLKYNNDSRYNAGTDPYAAVSLGLFSFVPPNGKWYGLLGYADSSKKFVYKSSTAVGVTSSATETGYYKRYFFCV